MCLICYDALVVAVVSDNFKQILPFVSPAGTGKSIHESFIVTVKFVGPSHKLPLVVTKLGQIDLSVMIH